MTDSQISLSKAFKRTKPTKKRVKLVLLYVMLCLVAVVYVIPLMWTLSTALKTEAEFINNPMGIIPKNPQFVNFYKVTQAIPFFQFVLNSLFVAFIVVIATCISGAMIGYAFSKLKWRGRGLCFTLCLATMMMPAQILQIPTFILHSQLGFIDTYFPLILPAFMGGSAYNVFLIAQFYRSIPNELAESAKIDGASNVRIWWSIMLRLVMPIVLAIGIFAFLNSWNDFFNPLIYLNSETKFTLALGLRGFQQQNNTQWDMMMAGSFLSMLPTLLLFFVFQKYFMEGISISSGVKG